MNMPLYSRRDLSTFLKDRSIYLTKQRGQHLLLDKNYLHKMLALVSLSSHDDVIEIGGGLGHLSALIAPCVRSLTVFEIDRKLAEYLKELFWNTPHVRVLCQDALKAEWLECFSDSAGRRLVISNVPYYLSSALLEKSFQYLPGVDKLLFTFQKDFAKRISVESSCADYSALSVFVQSYAVPRIHFKIAAQAFFPVPKVDSVVMTFECKQGYLNRCVDHKLFHHVVRSSFQQRRKTLFKVLRRTLSIHIDVLLQVFHDLALPLNVRGEQISIEKFIDIANALKRFENCHCA